MYCTGVDKVCSFHGTYKNSVILSETSHDVRVCTALNLFVHTQNGHRLNPPCFDFGSILLLQ